MLNRQIGAVNFAPLKALFLEIYQASRVSVSGMAPGTSLILPLHRNWKEADERQRAPLLPYTFQSLVNLSQVCYQLTTGGKFQEALESFGRLLLLSVVVVVQSEEQAVEVNHLVEIAREYVLGLKIELARRELPADLPTTPKRGVELAAYFTHCNLQAVHAVLSLRSAMALAFKLKCYQTAAVLIRRLLEMGPPPQLAEQVSEGECVTARHNA